MTHQGEQDMLHLHTCANTVRVRAYPGQYKHSHHDRNNLPELSSKMDKITRLPTYFS